MVSVSKVAVPTPIVVYKTSKNLLRVCLQILKPIYWAISVLGCTYISPKLFTELVILINY